MSFADILNQPLPSKASESEYTESDTIGMSSTTTGSVGDDPVVKTEPNQTSGGSITTPVKEESPYPDCEDGGAECGPISQEDLETDPESSLDLVDPDDDDEEFDPDDLTDEELAALDSELRSAGIDSVVPDEAPVTLTPDEEIEADDMMSVVATTALINKEMNAKERAEFAESEVDVQIAVNEGFLTESDVKEMLEDLEDNTDYTAEASYNKTQNVVHLNKKARLNQLFALAVNVSAAAHNDPDERKLRKLNIQRKILRQKLRIKYKGEALKRMKVYWKRLRASKSKPLSALAKKYDK